MMVWIKLLKTDYTVQFKRTWVWYNYYKILQKSGLLYLVKMSSMLKTAVNLQWLSMGGSYLVLYLDLILSEKLSD